MGLGNLLASWLFVAIWFLLWDVAASRLGLAGARGRAGWQWAGEALLVLLLGALWFASLGTGAWWLVFALLGALREWPSATRGSRGRKHGWTELAGAVLGVARMMVAGGILAWRLAPA